MELLSLLVWVQFCASLGVLLVMAEHLQQHGVVLEVVDEGGGHFDAQLWGVEWRERRATQIYTPTFKAVKDRRSWKSLGPPSFPGSAPAM